MNVKTWLPVFEGFYGTLYEPDGSEEEMEIENINECRRSKGLREISADDCQFDYSEYFNTIARMFTAEIEKRVVANGFAKSVVFENLRSPREYNFANDSIDVEIELDEQSAKTIVAYLTTHLVEFQAYLTDNYAPRSGFVPFYGTDAKQWADVSSCEHQHKLGVILQFILTNENNDINLEIYETIKSNGGTLSAKNYNELVPQ